MLLKQYYKTRGAILKVACTSILELHDNFVVKPKQTFAQLIQIFVFHWHFVDFLQPCSQGLFPGLGTDPGNEVGFSDDFHSITGRNRFKF